MILIAGPSDSGKSRVVRRPGLPDLHVDDFYLCDDDPAISRRADGSIDWDDPGTWDAESAADALAGLARDGKTLAPCYEIALNRSVGAHLVERGWQRPDK